jgi:hypothetical protein
MKPSPLFSGVLHDEMLALAETTGVGVPTVEAAALTLLSGLIGQRVLLPSTDGAIPLSLLTVAVLPPVKESMALIGKLAGTVNTAWRDAQGDFYDGRDAAEHFIKQYAVMLDAYKKLGDPVKLAEHVAKLAQAKLALADKLVIGDGEKSPSLFANAHDRTVTWAVTGHGLFNAEGETREQLTALMGSGFSNRRGEDRGKGEGRTLAALVGITRPSVSYVAAFKSVPFLVMESPSQGITKLGPYPALTAWRNAVAAFLYERMHSPTRILTTPDSLGQETERFLKQGINALTDRNPALMPYLAQGLTVMLRTAALLTLVEDPKALAIASTALTRAVDYCVFWMRAHAKAIGRVLPKPAVPRRPLTKDFDVPLDRGRLLALVSKNGAVSWRQIQQNIARARPKAYWDARLLELKERGCVVFQEAQIVSIPIPPERLAVLEGEGFLRLSRPLAGMREAPTSPTSPTNQQIVEKVEIVA